MANGFMNFLGGLNTGMGDLVGGLGNALAPNMAQAVRVSRAPSPDFMGPVQPGGRTPGEVGGIVGGGLRDLVGLPFNVANAAVSPLIGFGHRYPALGGLTMALAAGAHAGQNRDPYWLQRNQLMAQQGGAAQANQIQRMMQARDLESQIRRRDAMTGLFSGGGGPAAGGAPGAGVEITDEMIAAISLDDPAAGNALRSLRDDQRKERRAVRDREWAAEDRAWEMDQRAREEARRLAYGPDFETGVYDERYDKWEKQMRPYTGIVTTRNMVDRIPADRFGVYELFQRWQRRADPGAVVREGDIRMIESAVDSRIGTTWGDLYKWFSDESNEITEAQAEKVKVAIHRMLDHAEDQLADTYEVATGYADRNEWTEAARNRAIPYPEQGRAALEARNARRGPDDFTDEEWDEALWRIRGTRSEDEVATTEVLGEIARQRAAAATPQGAGGPIASDERAAAAAYLAGPNRSPEQVGEDEIDDFLAAQRGAMGAGPAPVASGMAIQQPLPILTPLPPTR